MSYLVQATLPCLVQGTLHYVISMIMTNLTIVLIEFSLVLWMINPQFFGGLMSENDPSTVLRMIYPLFCEFTLILLPPLSPYS